jgi:tetratricopeptide (TPR) repeat protein
MEYQISQLLYHSCRFPEAIKIVDNSSQLTPELAVVKIKCLYELDRGQEAADYANQAKVRFPESGLLDFFRGYAYYLARKSSGEIKRAFEDAISNGYPGGYLGLGFIRFLENDFKGALVEFDKYSSSDNEMDHIHLMMRFQVLLTTGKSAQAADVLKDSEAILQEEPSLIRLLWGQLCRIRLWRVQGVFDEAKTLNEELLRIANMENAPRVTRNALESIKNINKRHREIKYNMPPHLAAFPEKQTREIRRKPMLNSLMRFLYQRGSQGAPKEDIVNSVWGEAYNPLVHDERLYKAIGRLRKLLDDDCRSPKIISLIGRNYVLSLPQDMQQVQNQ